MEEVWYWSNPVNYGLVLLSASSGALKNERELQEHRRAGLRIFLKNVQSVLLGCKIK